MKKFLTLIGALLITTVTSAQDYPLKSERPKPLTATIVGVCEKRAPVIMVVIFTFDKGQVLIVDGKHMQGFSSAEEIVRYAATADSVHSYAQECADLST
jgi:hypothetical protein